MRVFSSGSTRNCFCICHFTPSYIYVSLRHKIGSYIGCCLVRLVFYIQKFVYVAIKNYICSPLFKGILFIDDYEYT